jgi:hypothetical protein
MGHEEGEIEREIGTCRGETRILLAAPALLFSFCGTGC